MAVIYGFSDRKFGDTGVNSNLRRFISSLGVEKPHLVRGKQVHGSRIALVGRKAVGKVIPGTDGLITAEKNLFLAVIVADCLPLLFYDPARGIVGAAHAGWRGTAARIGPKMVEKFVQLDSKPSNLEVLFGPCICWKHYEVGEDVMTRYNKVETKAELVRAEGKTFLDLRATNRNQLLAVGLSPENIKISSRCTFEDSNLYSWRREKPKLSGMFVGVIGIV